jgi:hypothetical protein
LAIDAFSTDPEVDRMLVVMNLYPLRARLPRNLAAVEDRLHELSFGNRLRQDHDTARRINALVETIEDLAALLPPDALDERLRARMDEARRYKIIDAIVNIDMQDPAATLVPTAQNPADDKDGMRDFSPETVGAGGGTGSDSRRTSCGLRSKIAGGCQMRRSRPPRGVYRGCPPRSSARSTLSPSPNICARAHRTRPCAPSAAARRNR